MQLQEVILCATQPASPTTGPGTISIHDIQTGSTLTSFKQTSSAVHSAGIVHTRNGQGGFMLAAQHDKSLLHVYYFQKVFLLTLSVQPL
jgi:pre-rRNA-processing protein IPI3